MMRGILKGSSEEILFSNAENCATGLNLISYWQPILDQSSKSLKYHCRE
jgi:hypothetical protein